MTNAQNGSPRGVAHRRGGSRAATEHPPAPVGLPARFGRNVLMNYAAQGLTALTALVLTPVLLHHLGKTTYGLWVVASGAVVYLELFELGFGAASTKLIAEDASFRPESALRTLNTTFFVLVPLGALALVGGVGLAFALQHIVHVSPQLRGESVAVVILLAVALATSIPGDTFGGALVGHQRYDLLALANASMTVATAAVSIAVVVGGHGVVMLAFATTVVSIVFQLVRLGMVRRILPGTRLSPRLIDPAQRRHAMHLSGWFMLQAVLNAVYATGDVITVGIVLGLKDAAIYAVGSKLAGAVVSALDSMAAVFFPFASAASRNDRESLGDIARDGTRVTMVPGIMVALVFIVLAGPGVRAWVGTGYGVSAQVLVVLAAAAGLASPVRALGNIGVGLGNVRQFCAIKGIEVTVNITLSVTLALVIGPVGVAIGTLGGVALARLPGYLVAGCRASGLSVRSLLRGALVPNILPAMACATVLLALRQVIGGSIPLLAVTALAGCATYLIVYLSTGAAPAERRRALAFVTRPLPARWRHGDESAAHQIADNSQCQSDSEPGSLDGVGGSASSGVSQRRRHAP
ncbi:MAG TPA: lipopolysaccharide biosynthesis protein [Acidimicrobiales bacterium]|nr:lipopolysaccharide biosynthesis protein [Acidimicrobiales bacterium]